MAFSRFAFFLASTVACGSAFAAVESTYYGEIPEAGDVNAVAEYEELRKFGQGVPATNIITIPNTGPCPPAQVEVDGNPDPKVITLKVHFHTDKHQCGGDHTEALTRAIEAVSQYLTAPVKVIILGHTDARGDFVYNMDLGGDRATSLANLLRSEGFQPTHQASCGKVQSTGGNVAAERSSVAVFFTDASHLDGFDPGDFRDGLSVSQDACNSETGIRVRDGVPVLRIESAPRPD